MLRVMRIHPLRNAKIAVVTTNTHIKVDQASRAGCPAEAVDQEVCRQYFLVDWRIAHLVDLEE